MINEQIRDREVRLIGENGEQLGIMSAKDAYKLAKEAELDLVKIAPTAKPPVCKIIDYGKYRYELARKEKEAKKKQKVIEIKEVRLSPNIDENDLNTKMNNARKFLEKGNKVKVTLRFRGREMAHMSKTKYILDDFAEKLADIAAVDKPAKVEGRSIVLFLSAPPFQLLPVQILDCDMPERLPENDFLPVPGCPTITEHPYCHHPLSIIPSLVYLLCSLPMPLLDSFLSA